MEYLKNLFKDKSCLKININDIDHLDYFKSKNTYFLTI